ncbi:hypothetical protein [Blastococcus sp. VKM Ac-2987]|uniref:hypothetical protein n=1 Tax=Blastococcus sp. VKM Ac-2987 TaxID=3004141 RepID=UPI0022AB8F80|nr:hypothetical protein [Blastococcus sp. VKM Ac-2987]MCZ2857871.1 hypothetical protein [Blastococcus sp. VKM Ac-2987]
MSGRFPSLGFDPAPGDVAVAGQVAAGVTGAAQVLERIAEVLTGAADGEWRGSAAIAFRNLLSDEFRPKVQTAARSFDEASRTLHDWLETMHAGRRRALALEAEHAAAVRRAQSAHATYAAIPAAAPAPAPDPDAAPPTPEQAAAESERLRARAAAGRAAGTADAEVERIAGEARALLAGYEQAGQDAAGRLQRAIDIAPDEPGFWAGLAEDVGEALAEIQEFAHDVDDWILEGLDGLAPLLDLIGDVTSLLSTACGFLAFVPGLQFLAGPALVLGLVSTGFHYLTAVGDTGSFTEALTDGTVLMDAAGVALGFGALKVGSQVVAAARTGSSASVAGGAAGRTQLFGPPTETAASWFQLARSTSYRMGETELLWRVARYKVNQAGLARTVAAGDPIRSEGTWLWDRSLTRQPSVVR